MLLSLLLITAASGIRASDEIVLFPNGAPNEKPGWPGPETRRGNDGSGCGANHSTMCDHIYNVSAPTLTQFLVANGTGAAIIIAPGGGYKDLAWTKEGLDIARLYNSMGVSAFVLKYRVPARPAVEGLPKWWAPLQDAQRAMSVVRARAKEWGVDTSRIGFTGFSAGGHLTAHISTTWDNRAYANIDSSDDVSSRPDFSLFMYPWMLLEGNRKQQPWVIAKELDIKSTHPVSFFCQNEDDNAALVEGTLAYYLKLKDSKAPMSDLKLFPKGGHGFGLCQGMKQVEEVCSWPEAASRFLQNRGIIAHKGSLPDSSAIV